MPTRRESSRSPCAYVRQPAIGDIPIRRRSRSSGRRRPPDGIPAARRCPCGRNSRRSFARCRRPDCRRRYIRRDVDRRTSPAGRPRREGEHQRPPPRGAGAHRTTRAAHETHGPSGACCGPRPPTRLRCRYWDGSRRLRSRRGDRGTRKAFGSWMEETRRGSRRPGARDARRPPTSPRKRADAPWSRQPVRRRLRTRRSGRRQP